MLEATFRLPAGGCVHATFGSRVLGDFATAYLRPFYVECADPKAHDAWSLIVREVGVPNCDRPSGWCVQRLQDPDRPFPESVLAFHPYLRQARLQVVSTSPEAPYVAVRVVRSLMTALAQRTMVLLHGSAVERDGAVLAMVGPKRSGKTTMWIQLARLGAAFLSNDRLLLHGPSGTVHGLPTSVTVREGLLRRIGTPLTSDYYLRPREEGALRLRVGELCRQLGVEVVPSGLCRAVVALTCRPGPMVFHQAVTGEARRLLESQVLGADDYQPFWERAVGPRVSLGRHPPVFGLGYAPGDEAAATEVLHRLLVET